MRKDLARTEAMLQKVDMPFMDNEDRNIIQGESKYFKFGKAKGKVKRRYKTEIRQGADPEDFTLDDIIGQKQVRYKRDGGAKKYKTWGSLDPFKDSKDKNLASNKK